MADANKLFYTFPPERQVSDKEYDDQIKAFIQKLDKISAKEYTKGAGTDKSLLNVCVTNIDAESPN